MSGFDSLFGLTFSDGSEMGGTLFALLLFAFPVLLILSKYIKELEPYKKLIFLILPIGSILSLFLVKVILSGIDEYFYFNAFGFWLYFLVSTALLFGGYLEYKNIPLDKESLSTVLNQNNQSQK